RFLTIQEFTISFNLLKILILKILNIAQAFPSQNNMKDNFYKEKVQTKFFIWQKMSSGNGK
ncbi:hypothetical protein AB8U03_06520, partial [Clostridium sp. Mt-5]